MNPGHAMPLCARFLLVCLYIWLAVAEGTSEWTVPDAGSWVTRGGRASAASLACVHARRRGGGPAREGHQTVDRAFAVADALPDAVNVEGSWSPDAKADALEAFQDGQVRVLVTKPRIAGMGMNFQNAHRMVFVGMSDSYEAYYQAVRRCWRFGQTEPVDVHIVVSELEQQIVQNVRRKEAEAATMTAHLVHAMHTTIEETQR